LEPVDQGGEIHRRGGGRQRQGLAGGQFLRPAHRGPPLRGGVEREVADTEHVAVPDGGTGAGGHRTVPLHLEVHDGDHLPARARRPLDAEDPAHAHTGDGDLRARAEPADIGELGAVLVGAPADRHPQRVDHEDRAQHAHQAVGEQLEGGPQAATTGHRTVTSVPRTSGASMVHAAAPGSASGSASAAGSRPGSGEGPAPGPGSPPAATACSSRSASLSPAARTVGPGRSPSPWPPPARPPPGGPQVDPSSPGYRGQSSGPYGIGSANDGTAVMANLPVENAAVPASPIGRSAYRVRITPCGSVAVRSKTSPVSCARVMAPGTVRSAASAPDRVAARPASSSRLSEPGRSRTTCDSRVASSRVPTISGPAEARSSARYAMSPEADAAFSRAGDRYSPARSASSMTRPSISPRPSSARAIAVSATCSRSGRIDTSRS